MTGARIGAGEALDLHLVSRVVPADSLMTEARELARQLSEYSPLALQAVKDAVYRGYDMNLAEGLKLESDWSAMTMASENFIRGRASFLEKKKQGKNS